MHNHERYYSIEYYFCNFFICSKQIAHKPDEFEIVNIATVCT